MTENWRPVKGYEDKYEVSDCGRVKRVAHEDTTFRRLPEYVQRPVTFNKQGHLRAALSDACITKRYSIHRLVLETFIGPCPPGMQACHNDGNPKNNKLGNLRWDSHKANQRDRITHGTDNCGERGSCAKLREDDVYRMRDLRICGATYQQIADWFNVTLTTARRAVTRQTWMYI